tara:strand:+ start:795 stop:1016 length:222 start_codon:yes stop_codon:yes gene_type:complete
MLGIGMDKQWENFHVVNTKDVTNFKLVGWEGPEPTIRKLMKRLRTQFPHKEWRVEPYSAYGSIKWIQYRRRDY